MKKADSNFFDCYAAELPERIDLPIGRRQAPDDCPVMVGDEDYRVSRFIIGFGDQ